jgi:hypothetical protein
MKIRKRRQMTNTGSLAAIYCRVSTVRPEKEAISVVIREEHCGRYTVEHDHRVDDMHVYRDV